MKNEVIVSVVMLTYGHELFIKEAIDGVLAQKTSYTFELLVANDCSPDNSGSIIKDYLENHINGHLIRYIKREKNIGMQANLVATLKECNGKYIAFCEGDDYWTDTLKLQKQIDFLEINNDYGIVHTDTNIYWEDQKKLQPKWYAEGGKNFNPNEFPELIFKFNPIRTCTVVIRSKIIFDLLNELPDDVPKIDLTFWIYAALKAKVHYMIDCTATYRILSNSSSHLPCFDKMLQFREDILEIRKWYISYSKLPEKYFTLALQTHYREIVRLSYKFNNRLYSTKALPKTTNNLNFSFMESMLIFGYRYNISFILFRLILKITNKLA